MMRDWWPHAHGGAEHAHAWASLPHDHLQRAVCTRPECEDCQTHNIHPAPTLGEALPRQEAS